jgi:tape measure domain-containing protein
MANSIAKLAILLTANTTGLTKGFAMARAQTQQFSQSLKTGDASGGMGSVFGIGMANPWAVAAAGAASLATWATVLAENSKAAAINFGVMMGSASDAQNLLSGLKDFAIDSPFSQGQLQQNAQTLLAFGMAGDSVIPTLKTIGDISLGNAEKMDRLSLAFAQTQAAGRLMGQDLLQMVNAGFNPLQEISRITGRSMGELKKAMEEGAISAQLVALAFKAATEEGGRFHEGIKAQEDTLKNRWNRLMENLGETVKPGGSIIGTSLGVLLEGWNKTLTFFRTGSFPVKGAMDEVADSAKTAAEQIEELAGKIKVAGLEFKGWDTEGFMGQLERFEKWNKSIGERGSAFADSFRTPAQEFAAAISEAKTLFDGQAISAEVYARAIQKAKDDLKESADSARDIQSSMSPSTPALSRRTVAGISAVYQAQQQQASEAEAARADAAMQAKHAQLLERILRALERGEININEVTL